MATVQGTLLVQNGDYGKTVSAVDITASGQMTYIVYVDPDGNLKTASSSFVENLDGSPRVMMSGCTVS